jgi:hypothetical protein
MLREHKHWSRTSCASANVEIFVSWFISPPASCAVTVSLRCFGPDVILSNVLYCVALKYAISMYVIFYPMLFSGFIYAIMIDTLNTLILFDISW